MVGGNPWTVHVLYTDTLTRGGGRGVGWIELLSMASTGTVMAIT